LKLVIFIEFVTFFLEEGRGVGLSFFFFLRNKQQQHLNHRHHSIYCNLRSSKTKQKKTQS